MWIVTTMVALLGASLTAVVGAAGAAAPAKPGPGIIDTYTGDGGTDLITPAAIAVGDDGTLYVTATGNNRIRKVDPQGNVTVFAGTGEADFSGDGGPAVGAEINYPEGMAIAPDGDVYIADSLNYRIRRIDSSGVITTVAGDGTDGFSGDDGLATDARVGRVGRMAFDEDGALFFADLTNRRVRRIDTDGVITTIAGNGTVGYSGDGGPAIDAAFADPTGVAVDEAGNVYISDGDNNRVRMVDTDGIITTVAGNGQSATSGDGGPATGAAIDGPAGLAFDSAGNLHIAAVYSRTIRKVDTDGIISTVAGNGLGGHSGDGGAALEAKLNSPSDVAFDADDNLYIADAWNNRVRIVGATESTTDPDPPATSAGEAFVRAAYEDYIGRAPSAAELSAGVGVVGEGASSPVLRARFSRELSESAAYVDSFLNKMYVDTLGRNGDPSGLAHWRGQLLSGKRTPAQVGAYFYASPEYFKNIGGGTVESWVTDLYGKLLLRSPDSSGLAHWVKTANRKGRNAVSLPMFQSMESGGKRVDALYDRFLDRAPDAEGRRYWAKQVIRKGDLVLATNLTSSAEYLTKARIRFP